MCDTFVALPSATSDGSVIFAKNSDREANEAQALEYHPAADYAQGAVVHCTYITIPQARHTHAVLISRPFWMWGAEMGANEHGVVIGNEAVFTKLKVRKDGVLTGMDLLRLGLERAKTAAEAKDVIIRLLEKCGQGGICGYRDKSFVYHNSFIVADPQEAWVLETAGEYWAAKKVSNYYAISNGLTIEDNYDEIHPGAMDFARKKGWVKRSRGFASAFSDGLYTHFSACRVREKCAMDFLHNSEGKITPGSAMAHLRSHHSESYNPSSHLLSNSICAHAANPLTRHASQTTGSLIAHLRKDKPLFWVTGTSAPCLSFFKPVWFEKEVLPDLGQPVEVFDNKSYWWSFERLHRTVLHDYRSRAPVVKIDQSTLEAEIIQKVSVDGKGGYELTEEAFDRSRKVNDELYEKIKGIPISGRPNLFYRRYWKKLNKQAGMYI